MFVEQANLVIWSFSCEEQKNSVCEREKVKDAKRYTVQ